MLGFFPAFASAMSDSSFVYRTPVEARANVEAKPAPPFRGLTTARTAVSVSKSTAAGVGGLGAW
jgi:hypothetical protein